MTQPSPADGHRRQAERMPPVRVALLTISDTRTPETDESGKLARRLIEEAGQIVREYGILPDEPDQIRARVEQLAASGEIDAIITNGGTGISLRDRTYEAVSGLLEKEIPGFGELFRRLSWDEVGSAAMLTRAIAGLRRGVLIFVLPGSPNAVEVGLAKLILPELEHLVWEMRR